MREPYDPLPPSERFGSSEFDRMVSTTRIRPLFLRTILGRDARAPRDVDQLGVATFVVLPPLLADTVNHGLSARGTPIRRYEASSRAIREALFATSGVRLEESVKLFMARAFEVVDRSQPFVTPRGGLTNMLVYRHCLRDSLICQGMKSVGEEMDSQEIADYYARALFLPNDAEGRSDDLASLAPKAYQLLHDLASAR